MNRDSGKGALQITSIPKSKVYLDGDFIGETPLCKCQPQQMLPVGQYEIKIVPEEDGLSTFEQRVQINSAVLTVVDRTFGVGSVSNGSIITLTTIPDKNDAQIMVISFPDKANIFLDNNSIGMTPLLLKNLTPSDHEIKLTKDGYLDKVVKIRAVSGFRLETDIYIGINDSSSPSLGSSSSANIKTQQVEILPTPTGFLRVRLEANLSSLEVGKVIPGERYDLILQQGDWYQIKLGSGKLGWVSSQYVNKL